MDAQEGRELAELAGLDPTEGAREDRSRDWTRIVAFFGRVVEGEPRAEAVLDPLLPPRVERLREDHAAPPSPRKEIMGNTTFEQDGFYRVPRVMP